MAVGAAFYYADTMTYEEKARNKFLTADRAELFALLEEKLAGCSTFDEANLEQTFAEIMQQTGLKFGKIAQPLRVALTGGTASPGIYEVLQVLGRQPVLQRLAQARQTLSA
jgi:glutamyl-tRNA synthetase